MSSLSEFLRKRREDKYTYDANGMKVKKKKDKTVTDLKVSKKYLPLRISLFVIFLGGGITAICFGVASMSNVAKGWKAVTSNGGKSNASNFNFMYYFSSDNGQDNGAMYKSLCNMYTDWSQKAYFVLSSDESTTGTNNIYYLNRHFNEETEVDPLLYNALKEIVNEDNKVIYFAPIYDQYQNLFNADNDITAKTYDPYYSTAAANYYQTIANYVNNGDIYFSFPSENKVILNVSSDYITFLNEHNITKAIDMSYLSNAISIDYFVDCLEEANYRNYRISSYEGYVRTSVDISAASVQSFNYNYYTFSHKYILPNAVITLNKPTTLVEFKSFPASSNEDYYLYEDISFVHHFLDDQTGKYLAATESLYMYGDAKEDSVLDILLAGSKIYIQDTLDIPSLTSSDYKFIYTDGNKVKYNESELTFASLLEVNFCNVCGTAFAGSKCSSCGSTDFENVKYEKELIND